ncbi:MAG: hypothetical protein ACTSQ3_03125 [Candidatus Heimdallarchaeota archaeon]
MKTRLLKKVNQRIRIVENKGKFVVEIKDKEKGGWRKLTEFKKREDAHYQRYHYYKTFLLKDFMVKLKYMKKYDKR